MQPRDDQSQEYELVRTDESNGNDDANSKEIEISDELQPVSNYCCGLCEKILGTIGYDDINLHSDSKILFLTKAVRMFSFGFLIVFLVEYLEALGFRINLIGLFFTLTLCGDAIISLSITSYADRFGRKQFLIIGGILSLFTGIVFMVSKNFLSTKAM